MVHVCTVQWSGSIRLVHYSVQLQWLGVYSPILYSQMLLVLTLTLTLIYTVCVICVYIGLICIDYYLQYFIVNIYVHVYAVFVGPYWSILVFVLVFPLALFRLFPLNLYLLGHLCYCFEFWFAHSHMHVTITVIVSVFSLTYKLVCSGTTIITMFYTV